MTKEELQRLLAALPGDYMVEDLVIARGVGTEDYERMDMQEIFTTWQNEILGPEEEDEDDD